MLRSCFLKMPFPWRLRNQDGGSRQFRTWRRRAQTAVFVSSQDRRAREKHCVFLRRTEQQWSVCFSNGRPFSPTSAGKSASSITRSAAAASIPREDYCCHLHKGDQVLLGGHWVTTAVWPGKGHTLGLGLTVCQSLLRVEDGQNCFPFFPVFLLYLKMPQINAQSSSLNTWTLWKRSHNPLNSIFQFAFYF